MFARCARVDPATGRSCGASAAKCTTSVCLSCATVMPSTSVSVREPLAPFTVTFAALTVADTPWGRSTGFLATRDMDRIPGLGDHAQDFAALAHRARLAVGHDALGGGDDGYT